MNIATKYPYHIYSTRINGKNIWITESKCLKGCVGQGNTRIDAIKKLKINEEEWLKVAEKYGTEIPEIPKANS